MAKANLRDIRKRISSVRSTQQITKAMKMVAAAKLRRAQENMMANSPYATKIYEMLSRLAARTSADIHPLLARRDPQRLELILFTSDRGLCGAYNINLMQRAEKFLEEEKKKYEQIYFSFIGRKGRDYFRKRKMPIHWEKVNFFGRVDYNMAAQIGQDLIKAYTANEVDMVCLLYSEFISPLQQRPVLKTILPIAPRLEEEELEVDYLYEPSAAEILSQLLPLYIEVQIYQALLESLASEYGARMAAMENATKNAAEMIDKLTLFYNKVRQASITKELIEIVSGAEALK
ncbi:MAG: ATP synthase F1 subunit gamma [Thermodesulfobacteriota bacterium]